MSVIKRVNFRFAFTLIVFAGVVLLTYREEVLGPLLAPLTTLTAKTTFVLLELLRLDVMREVSVIYQPGGFAFEIYYRCTGFLPVACLAVSILGYRGHLRHKLVGLAVGVPLLIVLNLIRLVHLFLIGVTKPEHFELAHRFFWEGAMVLAILVLWLAWRYWAQARTDILRSAKSASV